MMPSLFFINVIVLSLLVAFVAANGTFYVDNISSVANDGTNRVKADSPLVMERGGESVVTDFSSVTTTKDFSMDVRGGLDINAESLDIGSNGQGPVSVDAESHELNLFSNELSINGKDTSVSASGDVASFSGQTVAVKSAQKFSVTTQSVRVQSSQSVTANANAANLQIRTANTTNGRVDVQAFEAIFAGDTQATITTKQNVVISGGQTAELTGDSITASGAKAVEVQAPLGDVFIDSANSVGIAGVSTKITGRSSVRVNVASGNTALSTTAIGSNVNLSGGHSVAANVGGQGATITSTVDSIKGTAGSGVSIESRQNKVTFDSPSSMKFSSETNMQLVGNTVSIAPTGTVSLTTKTLRVVSGAGKPTFNTNKFDVQAGNKYDISAREKINVNAGTTGKLQAGQDLIIGANESATFTGSTVSVSSTGATNSLTFGSTSSTFNTKQMLTVQATATDVEYDTHRNLGVASAGGILLKGTNNNAGIASISVISNNDLKVQSTADLKLESETNAATFTNVDKLDWAFTNGNSVITSKVQSTRITTERDLSITAGTKIDATSTAVNKLVGERSTITGDANISFKAKTTADIKTGALEASIVSSVGLVAGAKNTFSIDANRNANIDAKSVTINTINTQVLNSAVDINTKARESMSITSVTADKTKSGVVLQATQKAIFEAHGPSTISSADAMKLDGNNGVIYSAEENFSATSAGDNTIDNEQQTNLNGEEITMTTINDTLTVTNPTQKMSITVLPASGVPTSYVAVTGAGTGALSSSAEFNVFVQATNNHDADGEINISGIKGVIVKANKAISLTNNQKQGDDVHFNSDGSITFASTGTLNSVTAQRDVTGNFASSSTITSTGKDVNVVANGIGASDLRSVIINNEKEGTFTGSTLVDVDGANTLIEGSDTIQIVGGTQLVKSLATTVTVTSQGGQITMDSDVATLKNLLVTTTTNIESTSAGNNTFIAKDGFLQMLGKQLNVVGGNTSISSGAFKQGDIDVTSKGFVSYTTGNNKAARFNANNLVNLAANTAGITMQTVGSAAKTYKIHDDSIFVSALKADTCISNLQSNAFKVNADNYLSVMGGEDVLIQSTTSKIVASTDAVGSITFSSDGWDHDPKGVLTGFSEPLGLLVRNTAAKSTKFSATKGIWTQGLEGVSQTSTGAFSAVATKNLIIRSDHPQARTTLQAQKGTGVYTANAKTFFRAGTSSIDGDLRFNATGKVGFTTTNGNIAFTHLGSSSNTENYGIKVLAFNGNLNLKAETYTIAASGTFNATTETGDLTTTSGAGAVTLTSLDRRIEMEGQTGVTVTSTKATFTSSGINGKTSITSADDTRIESTAQSVTFTAIESAIVSNADLNMKSSQNVDLQGTNVDIIAGGSVSIVSTTKSISTQAVGILDLDFASSVDVDSAALTFSNAGTGTLMRISAGGSESEDGIDVTSTGKITHTITTTAAAGGPSLLHSSQVSSFKFADKLNFQTVAGVKNTIGLTGSTVQIKAENGEVQGNYNNAGDIIAFVAGTGFTTTTNGLLKFTANANAAGKIAISSKNTDMKIKAPTSVSFLSKKAMSFQASDDIIVTTKTDDIIFTSTESAAQFIGHSFFKAAATDGITIEGSNDNEVFTIQTQGTNADIYFKAIGALTATSLKNILLTGSEVNVDGPAGVSLIANEENEFTATKDAIVTSDALLTIQANEANKILSITSAAGNINSQAHGLASKIIFTTAKEFEVTAGADAKFTASNILLQSDNDDNTHAILGTFDVLANSLLQTTTKEGLIQGSAISFRTVLNDVTDFDGIVVASTNAVKFNSASTINIASKSQLQMTTKTEVVIPGKTLKFITTGRGVDSLSLTSTDDKVTFNYDNSGAFNFGDQFSVSSQKITTASSIATVFTSTQDDIILTAPDNTLTYDVDGNEIKIIGNGIVYSSTSTLQLKATTTTSFAAKGDINIDGTPVASSAETGKLLSTAREGINVESNVLQIQSAAKGISFTTSSGNVGIKSASGAMDVTLANKAETSNTGFIEFSSAGAMTLQAEGALNFERSTKASRAIFESRDDDILFAQTDTFKVDGIASSTTISFSADEIAFSNKLFMQTADNPQQLRIEAEGLVAFKQLKQLTAVKLLHFDAGRDVIVDVVSGSADDKIILNSPSLFVEAVGPRSHIEFFANNGGNANYKGKTFDLVARNNLGANGILFKSKSYNPHGIEIGSMYGSTTIDGKAGPMGISSAGWMQFRGADSILIGKTKIGYFNQTPAVQQTRSTNQKITACGDANKITFVCTNWAKSYTSFDTALTNIGLLA